MEFAMRSGLQPHLGAEQRKATATGAAEGRWVAEASLGGGHPLVVLAHAQQRTIAQLLSVASMLVAGAVLMWGGAQFGLSAVAAAALVEIGLGCRLGVIMAGRREAALALIVDGRGGLPVAAVQRQRGRLVDARRRAVLARSLEQIAALGDRGGTRTGGPRPIFDVRVVRALAPQLRETARLLRSDRARVRGVALVEWLVTCGAASPLYGSQVEPLRQELARARYLLG